MRLHNTLLKLGLIGALGVLLMLVPGGTNVSLAVGPTPQQPTYPVSTPVRTTLDGTVTAVPLAPNTQRVLPNDVASYAKYGYGAWQMGQGLRYERRLDLMPPAYAGASAGKTLPLLRFFSMSDIHITDAQSPAQAIYFGLQPMPGMQAAYSAVIPYTTHVLDAAVQTVNALNKKKVFDFGIFLGDAINNGQNIELRWYIDVIDGRPINPNSDPKSTSTVDYTRPYHAGGLDRSIPWYQVLGNHDHFWSGMYPPNQRIKETMVGENVLDIGNVLTDPNLDHRGFYTGLVDGSTAFQKVVFAGPEAGFSTPPKIAANADRRWLGRNDWLGSFFNTTSRPVGHGFPEGSVKTGFACYTFEPKAGLPLRVIVLDDTEKDDGKFGHNGSGASGSLDQERYDWLVKELDRGQADGKLMIVAAHVPIGVDKNLWDSASFPSENTLIDKLHTYPNLILWIAGHRHYNTVTPFPPKDSAHHPELGFWEVETASLRDFPQQFRLFDIVRNSDNTISIFTTNVDPSVTPGTPAAQSRSYAVAADEIFAGGPPLPYLPSGAYNAELVKHLSAEMAAKIATMP
jgi:metallophosphoesterase (TIGR03768 family)